MKKRKRPEKISEKILVFWIPAIIWLAVIFYLSSRSTITIGSGGLESFVLRKFAHVGEFGVLAVLFLLPIAKKYGNRNYLSFLLAFGLATLFAFGDEFHQTFVFGRHGNLKDVLIDALGAALFLQFVAFIIFEKRRLLLASTIIVNLLAIFFVLVNMVQTLAISNRSSIDDLAKQNQQSNENLTSKINENSKLETTPSGVEAELLTENVETENKEVVGSVEREKDRSTDIVIPKSVLLPVPFSSQAPFGVWDELHEEACEEMSLIMVKYYLDKKELTPQAAEDEIQKLKDYQLEKNGHFIDSDMEEVAEMAKEHFGLTNVILKNDITKQDILESLVVGNPVIIPTAGRLLGNPNFSGLGPLYHNIVIVGFEDDEFITNDPGTRNGKHYRYKFDTIMEAIHDYTGDKNEIEKGPKRGLIFSVSQ